MRKRLKLMHHTMRIAVRLDDALLSPRVDDEARQILLTASSACDPQILEKMNAWLQRTGGTALVTSGFVEDTMDRGIRRMTSIRFTGRRIRGRNLKYSGSNCDQTSGYFFVSPSTIAFAFSTSYPTFFIESL